MGHHLFFKTRVKESPFRSICSISLISHLILFISFVFCCALESRAQRITVSGQVRDSASGIPLQFANVFVNNTTINTVTDEQGKYSLTASSPGTYELVVSFVGYHTLNRKIELQTGNNPIFDFSLEPKEDDLEEIDVTSRMDKKWGRQLKRFEKVFIGNPLDSIAGAAKILNPWVLDFGEGKSSDGPRYFYATATEPIQIENAALGYKIYYDLQDFKQTRNGFNYLGLSRFEEMEATSKQISELWHENRQRVFFGSTRHLLKTLIEKDTASKEYQLYEVNLFPFNHKRTNTFSLELGKSLELIPIDSIAKPFSISGRNLLVSNEMLEVHHIKGKGLNNYYRDVYNPISWLIFKNDSLVVDPNGVPLDPAQLILSGQMAEYRMGRFLPLDFQADLGLAYLQEEENFIEDPNKWNSLREKPFVQTDKPYYYPGETIWFKSNMLYQNPIMADSLSRVLYVELIGEKGEISASGIFPIEKSKTSGMLKLPQSLVSGNYLLRAYTNWMRNFGENDFYYQPIPVPNLYQNLEMNELPATILENDPELVLEMKTSKDVYGRREKVTVDFSILDLFGQPIEADFSVSVTDIEQVTPIDMGISTITSAVEWMYTPEKIQLPDTIAFPIEYGIGLVGEFLNTKGVPEKAKITIVQGNYDDFGEVETDSMGHFWASGLYFYDSAEIALAALNPRLRPYGSVKLLERALPPAPTNFPKLNLIFSERSSPLGEFGSDNLGDYMSLEQVTVEDEKLQSLEERNYGYGSPDRSLKEENLKKWPGMFLDAFISMSMPGASSTRISNLNYGLNAGDPLLIIDGARYQGDVFNKLRSFVTDEVESIDIYTHNAHIFGMAGFAGVIMVKTKMGSRISDDPNTAIFNSQGFSTFTIKGFNQVKEFLSPDYARPEQMELQDKRFNTLFWNPSQVTDKDTGKLSFSFYAGEVDSIYRILIQGLTDENMPFRVVKEIRVKGF